MAGPFGGSPLWARFVDSEPRRDRPDSPAWIVPRGAPRLPPPEAAAEGCPIPYDWDRRAYAALDVETTGLESSVDRVVEIGLALFSYDSEGALVEEKTWTSLVNPGIPIPASASAIHGINDIDVFPSPFFDDIASELASLLQGRVMVAHNAPFDAGFIDKEFARLGAPSPFGEIADSLVLLRLAVPNLLSYNLGKAAFVLGIGAENAHRALGDARACMRLFTHSLRLLSGLCP